jgi:hypothetical protein
MQLDGADVSSRRPASQADRQREMVRSPRPHVRLPTGLRRVSLACTRLYRELPVRLARRAVELEKLPHGLSEKVKPCRCAPGPATDDIGRPSSPSPATVVLFVADPGRTWLGGNAARLDTIVLAATFTAVRGRVKSRRRCGNSWASAVSPPVPPPSAAATSSAPGTAYANTLL